MFAILFAALAPTVSMTLAAARNADSFWTEICSVNAPRATSGAAGTADKEGPTKRGLAFEQCAFCVMQGHTPALPAVAPVMLPAALVIISRLPLLFLQAPHPLFVWATPQSRAPPSRS